MKIKTTLEYALARLGALEQRRFDYVRHVVVSLRPFLCVLIALKLSQTFCDYVSVGERVLIIDRTLLETRKSLHHESTAPFDTSDQFGVAPNSSARTLEIINQIALAAGIRIDEVRSVKGCGAVAPPSQHQIQIAFRSSFHKTVEFDRRLNEETTTFVTESLVIERDATIEESETIFSKICVAIVPSSS